MSQLRSETLLGLSGLDRSELSPRSIAKALAEVVMTNEALERGESLELSTSPPPGIAAGQLARFALLLDGEDPISRTKRTSLRILAGGPGEQADLLDDLEQALFAVLGRGSRRG